MKLRNITIEQVHQAKKSNPMNLKSFIYRNNAFFVILFDIIIVSFSFLILAWYKPATVSTVIPRHISPFIVFIIIWVAVSHIMGKYNLLSFKKAFHMNITISIINFIVISIVTILLFALKLTVYSRLIVFGTSFLSYLIEIVVFNVIYSPLQKFNSNGKIVEHKKQIIVEPNPLNIITTESKQIHCPTTLMKELTRSILITRESGKNVFNYFSEHVNVNDQNVSLISTTTPFNVENLPSGLRTIINLKKVNDMRYINKFFEAANQKLPDAGMFMGCVETSRQRYNRIGRKFPAFIRQIVIMTDFSLNRIAPRLSSFKNLYFNITSGIKRTISKAEVLGRLVSCGFEIIEFTEINNLTYFVVMKTKTPEYNPTPSYGPIYKMPRIGKGGEIIYVYKFRTMHPYSEYLQDYVLKLNGFSAIGKPSDDFRLTKWGKFMRKYWLDEFPQLINVLKGEMKLVGIRPLSKRMLQEYPDDVIEMRSKYKPGCIPPYVSLLKQGVMASIEAERQYLQEKNKNPISTDIKYFKMAMYNIITNKIRSS
ncbi:MAG: sugar transferase [Bacteroidota bacterium]